MSKVYDIIGIGIGPFNLSLAALLAPHPETEALFLDQKDSFSWHDEIMFGDSNMQTSYLKDLVTPVEPTNPCGFLNYLVQTGKFYAFMNSGRASIKREEFQDYCRWCCVMLKDQLRFGQEVRNISLEDGLFVVQTSKASYRTKNISCGTGHTPSLPDCCKPFAGKRMFHAKSSELATCDMSGKKVVVVGGGQTGVEIFRNCLKGRWGQARELSLITGRESLRPLEHGPFVDEWFTPDFVEEFFEAVEVQKESLLKHQKLASDGNTPGYLVELYEEMYTARHISKSETEFGIYPMRRLEEVEQDQDGSFSLKCRNGLYGNLDAFKADMAVLATGFDDALPKPLKSLDAGIIKDHLGRPSLRKDYSLVSEFGENKIFGMNMGKRSHGIADPQISLMAQRSAVIINSLTGRQVYSLGRQQDNFCRYAPLRGEEEM